MNNAPSLWLEQALTESLRPVEAPWGRFPARPQKTPRRSWMPLAAATAALLTLALLELKTTKLDFPCTSASQLQAWVKESSGLDLPLPARLSPSVKLLGANRVSGGAEIVYTVNGETQHLRVESDPSAGTRHQTIERTAKSTSWTMGGQLYRVEYAKRVDNDAACALCHGGV